MINGEFSIDKIKQVYLAGGFDVSDAPAATGFTIICRPKEGRSMKNIAVLVVSKAEEIPSREKLEKLLQMAKNGKGNVDLVSCQVLPSELEELAEQDADLTIVEFESPPQPRMEPAPADVPVVAEPEPVAPEPVEPNPETSLNTRKIIDLEDFKSVAPKVWVVMAGAAVFLVGATLGVTQIFQSNGNTIVDDSIEVSLKAEPANKSPLINHANVALPESGYYSGKEVFADSKYSSFPKRRREQILYQAMKQLKSRGHLFVKASREMDENVQKAIFSFQEYEEISESGRLDDNTLNLLGLGDLKEEFVVSTNENFKNLIDGEMIWVDPGTFTRHEVHPPQIITLTQGFWIGATEVNQRQWSMLMGTSVDELAAGEQEEFRADEVGADYPLSFVDWNEAKEFCRKLTERTRKEIPEGWCYDLPSEAQWDRAYTAGTSFYHTKDYGWTGENSELKIQPIATKKPNPWGIYDMHGNVAEWVEDYYNDPNKAPRNLLIHWQRNQPSFRSPTDGSI